MEAYDWSAMTTCGAPDQFLTTGFMVWKVSWSEVRPRLGERSGGDAETIMWSHRPASDAALGFKMLNVFHCTALSLSLQPLGPYLNCVRVSGYPIPAPSVSDRWESELRSNS